MNRLREPLGSRICVREPAGKERIEGSQVEHGLVDIENDGRARQASPRQVATAKTTAPANAATTPMAASVSRLEVLT